MKSYDEILEELKNDTYYEKYEDKRLETIAMFRACSTFDSYEDSRLEPYFDFFDDIQPKNKREETISAFSALLFFYKLNKNSPKDIPMHNKVMPKQVYNKLNKEIKTIEDFLKIVELDDFSGFEILKNDVTIQALRLIDKNKRLLNSEVMTKTKMKNYLISINTKYNLKKSLEAKLLIDKI